MSTTACDSIQAFILYIMPQHVPGHKAMLLKPLPPFFTLHVLSTNWLVIHHQHWQFL